MADRRPDIVLTTTPGGSDLNLIQEWKQRQDRLDDLEFQNMTGAPTTEAKPAAPAVGEEQPPKPEEVLTEKGTKKAVDELVQYREMRATEGPDGGVYDATKLGRSGWKDEVARDPIAALTNLINEVTRSSSPDVTGGSPATPGDIKNMGKSLLAARNALKKITGAAESGKSLISPDVAQTNLARIEASDSVKQTIKQLNSVFGQAKKVATHQDTIAGSQNVSLEDLLATPDSAWTLEETRHKQQALRDADAAISTEVSKLHKAVLAGDETAAEAYLDTALLAGVLGNKNRMVGTGAGQLLEARKILADAERQGMSTRDLTDMITRLGIEGATSVEEIARIKAQMLAEGIDGLRLAQLMERIPGRARKPLIGKVWDWYKKIPDALHWLYLQFLLSGPQTHVANNLGNVGVIAAHYPERYLAEWIRRTITAFGGGADGVQRGETWAMMHVSGKAAVDGLKLMVETFKTGNAPLGKIGKVEAHFDLKASQFGWDPNTALGKLVDTVGMVTPTRLMMTEDGFYKGFNRTQELSALALREAQLLAKDGETFAEIASRQAKLFAKPTDDMVQAADAAANLRTLNNELGVAGKALMSARNLTPGAWAVMPFFQTPTNGIKWAWQRTPILGLISAQNIADIAAGGAARDLAISRVLLGHAVGGAVAYQVVQGNITGAMPFGKNKNLNRDAQAMGIERFGGKPPASFQKALDQLPPEYCIMCGDQWYGYKRTDPVGQYIGTIATAIEIYSQLHHADPAEFDYGDFVLASGLAASRVALDSPWLQGLGNVFHAIERPDVEGKKVALQFAKSIVPAGIQALNRSGSPFNEARPEVRELETILDAVRSGIPWMVDGVAPVLHPITGETIIRPPGWGVAILSPIFMSKVKDHPVLREIIKHGMEFQEPKKFIYGSDDRELALDPTRQPDGVKLSEEQYFRLKQLATTDLQDGRGRTMQEAMIDFINSDAYRNASGGPDHGKEQRLKIIYHDFYKRAEVALKNEYPSLDKSVREKKEKKIRESLNETSPNYLPKDHPGVEAFKKLLPSL